nr:ribonuclease H-like domain-containing protein [Tanacetum cinerariifolium]
MEDKVMLNNIQGKKQDVEDHRRNVKISNNKMYVTACNDSLNAKTSNVNFVCVTCGKYVLNDNHDKCVLHYLNGMNSRTKMHMVVPISTREPKHIVNQSVATPLRRTVALESTNQKPRHITRKQYENVSKTCSWWYPKFTPPGYKWKPKSQIGNVNPNVSMPLGNASRTANILEPMTPRCSTVLNTTLYSNSFAARRDNPIHRSVKFRNDQIAPILGYEDLGNDLLTGSRGTDLYSTTLQDTSSPNPICLMAKATSSQAWLWHRRLSHLNFNTINLLSKNDIVIGLPKLKFIASDHVSSDPVPQCPITALEHDSLSPGPQCQENVPQAAGIVTTSNELDLLFSLMFNELLNGSTQVVSKSFAVTTADAPNKCQQHHSTPLNTQTTPEPTYQTTRHGFPQPSSFQSTIGNLNLTTHLRMKWVPRSLMIARGIPNREKRDFKNLTTTLASLVGSAFASTHLER